MPKSRITNMSTDLVSLLREEVTSLTVGESVAIGNMLYIKSDGKLWKASNSAVATTKALFMALEAADADETCNVSSPYPFLTNSNWTWTPGGIIYLSTSGGMTQTEPTGTGTQLLIVGIAVTATSMVYCPGYCFFELS